MFDLDRFLADCQAALAAGDSHKGVQEAVARAVADPAAVLKTLGAPQGGGVHKLHHSPSLTVLNVVWPPKMTIMPHDHRMWVVIGIYTGREDNIFWHRLETGEGRGIEAAGAKALSEKDGAALGANIIHSVTNPIPRLSGAIHVYGGDFFAAERSQWDPESLREQRYDVERAQKMFTDHQ